MIIDCLYQNDCINKMQSLTRRQLEKLTGLSIHTVIKSTNLFIELEFIAEGVYDGTSKSYYLTQKGIDMLPFMVELILWSGDYDPDTEAGKEFLDQAKQNRAHLIQSIREELEREHLNL